MKISVFYKFKAFPYISPRKISIYQQWNPLRKLSKQNKRIFRSRNRIFSMEYKYPLSREIFLKMVTAFKESNFTTFKLEKTNKTMLHHFNKWQLFSFYHLGKNQFLNYSYYMVNSVRKTFSWNIFRYIFLKKIWMLSNPSLVPGISRPFKFKKNNLTKIRALTGLNHLIGDCNFKFTFFLVRKSWNIPNFTVPFFWNLPRTVESLKRNVLLKIGIVSTIPIARAIISRKNVLINGFSGGKNLIFAYTGDYFKFNLENFVTQKNVFNASPTERHLSLCRKTNKNIGYQKTQKFQKSWFKR